MVSAGVMPALATALTSSGTRRTQPVSDDGLAGCEVKLEALQLLSLLLSQGTAFIIEVL